MKYESQTRCIVWLTLIVAASVVGGRAHAIVPDDPGPADLRFTISSADGTKPISPYIYGVNGASIAPAAKLDRLGGNRWTGYNWETNASNAGADYYFQNDTHLGSGAAGNAIKGTLQSAAAANRGLIVTVPMAGYVSGDTAGPIQRSQVAPSSRWKEIVANKSMKYSGAGAQLSLTPNTSDGWVFTDELVNWVESTKSADQAVFYSLDNEPGLWGEPLPANWQPGNPGTGTPPSSQGRTHGELHPYAPRFDELRAKTIATAGAIKDVNPNALVFGGVGYGWNDFVSLQDAPDRAAHTEPSHPGGDQSGEMHYYEYLLSEVAAAEEAQQRTLMDVLDLHWYPEAQGGGTRITTLTNTPAVVAARVQAPRSLWDPTYVETSWISEWSTWSGSPGNPGPVNLLGRVKRDIADFKPGTKIAITEYNYGGTNHISGGVAQADALGIFGKEGVFAANLWNLHGNSNSLFARGAINMFLDYDGASGAGEFGDGTIAAATSNVAQSAVYASLDSEDDSRMMLVAINRTDAAKTVGLEVTHDRRFDRVEVYQLTAASSSPVRVANLTIDLVNAFQYTMPAMSVSTLVLRSFEDGDFTMDGVINESDLLVLQNHLGMEAGAHFRDGDNDRDGDVDGADFLGWQNAMGRVAATESSGSQTPEPTAGGLACGAAVGGAIVRRRRGKVRAPWTATRA